MGEFLTVKELCKTLNIGTTTLYRLLKKGLPHLKIGGSTRFCLEDVVKWLEEQQKEKGE